MAGPMLDMAHLMMAVNGRLDLEITSRAAERK